MGLEATFCLSPGIYATPQDFWSREQEYEVASEAWSVPGPYTIRGTLTLSDIDPEYMPFERLGT
jgi:hypothetical protein